MNNIKLCSISLLGFTKMHEEDPKLYKKIMDEIYDNCKFWDFFGDGLCFTCNNPNKCDFMNKLPKKYINYDVNKELKMKNLKEK